jgi:DNA-binding NarL/FixJ family response regulator
MGRIRVAVVDRMALLRAGIVQVLSSEPGIDVVAEGRTLEDARGPSARGSADVIFMDQMLLQGRDAEQALSDMCSRASVILTIFSGGEQTVRSTFSKGVVGCILKGCERQEILDSVRTVCQGEGYVSPALAATVMRSAEPHAKPSVGLTHREEQIFELLCVGLKNQEIGARLNLAERTVKHYVTRIFEILNVRNRVEAAALASKRGATVECLKPYWSTLPNGTPVMFSAKGRAQPTSDKAIAENSWVTTHSATWDAPPEPTPGEKTAAAAYFSAVFGNVPEDAGRDSVGSRIILPGVILRRRH